MSIKPKIRRRFKKVARSKSAGKFVRRANDFMNAVRSSSRNVRSLKNLSIKPSDVQERHRNKYKNYLHPSSFLTSILNYHGNDNTKLWNLRISKANKRDELIRLAARAWTIYALRIMSQHAHNKANNGHVVAIRQYWYAYESIMRLLTEDMNSSRNEHIFTIPERMMFENYVRQYSQNMIRKRHFNNDTKYFPESFFSPRVRWPPSGPFFKKRHIPSLTWNDLSPGTPTW